MEQSGIWTEKRKIEAINVGPSRKLKLTALQGFLQEIAGNHAHSYGVGFHGMREKELYWVLQRLQINMLTYPDWRQTIHHQTWIKEMKGPFSYREFMILSDTGESMAKASTIWTAVSSTSYRPQRVDSLIDNWPIIPEKHAIEEVPPRLRLPDAPFEERDYQVQFSDLDMLNHVNNTKYLEWVFNTYSLDWWENKLPEKLIINFSAEVRAGQQLSIRTYEISADTYLHGIMVDEKPACMIQLSWKEVTS
ncbi:MAG: acyl-ACP thioesterase domain-containing protein [Bacteroidota bacterium]